MKKGVKYGSPRWILELLHQEFPDHFRKHGVGRWATIEDSYWREAGLDHPRTYKSKVVIWQPYFAKVQLGALLTAFAKHNLLVDINGTSPYFNGRTFSIIVARPEDKELFYELLDFCRSTAPDKQVAAAYKDWI